MASRYSVEILADGTHLRSLNLRVGLVGERRPLEQAP